MKKYIPKILQNTTRIGILLGVEFIFSSVLYIVLATRGVSENLSLLIAFLTLVVGILVTVPVIHSLSLLLKRSHGRTSRGVAASRRELLRAGARGGITIALQSLLNEPVFP